MAAVQGKFRTAIELDFRTFEVVSGHADAAGVTMSGWSL